MFPKWWMNLVKEKMKGSGYKVTFIMSYNQAMIWNAAEAMLFLYTGVAVLYLINPVIGNMASSIALIPLVMIWSKMLRLMDYYGRNCWHVQPELKKGFLNIFGDQED